MMCPPSVGGPPEELLGKRATDVKLRFDAGEAEVSARLHEESQVGSVCLPAGLAR
jgi:hypothetical protein